MATEAIRRAVKKYDAANTVQFHLKLNVKTDAAIIEKLKSVEKVQTYLKELIAADVNTIFSKSRGENHIFAECTSEIRQYYAK